MTKNYANFVATNEAYWTFAHVLLNSLERSGVHYPTYIITDSDKQFDGKYSFPIHYVKISGREKYLNNNLFLKKERFKPLLELSQQYDAVCFLDADMWVVSNEFNHFYDLVAGTSKMIGCNERFKWVFDQRYQVDGVPLFPSPKKLHKFSCSVPLWFDMKQWLPVFKRYNELATTAVEVKGETSAPMGDMFTFNGCVYLENRQDDLILLPMESLTQVHGTAVMPQSRIRFDDGKWISNNGNPIYSMHGRISSSGWRTGQMAKIDKYILECKVPDEVGSKWSHDAKVTLDLIEKDWKSLLPKIKPEQSQFGGPSISEKEYNFLINFCKAANVKTVIEYGPGTSTAAFLNANCKVTSLETNSAWLKKYQDLYKDKVDFYQYKQGKIDEVPDLLLLRSDLAFVDGPPGTPTKSRYETIKHASQRSKYVAIHDYRRAGEQESIKELLKDWAFVEEIERTAIYQKVNCIPCSRKSKKEQLVNQSNIVV